MTGATQEPVIRKWGRGCLIFRCGSWYARCRLLSGERVYRCFKDRKDLADEFLDAQYELRQKQKHLPKWKIWQDIKDYDPSKYPSGNVYMVQAGDYVKIGYTTNINKRLPNFVSYCPFDVKLLFCIAGSIQLEGEIHSLLRDYHVKNEWFLFALPVQKVAIMLSAEKFQSQSLKPRRKPKTKPWVTMAKDAL